MIVKNKTLRILGIVGGVFFSILLVTALLASLFFSAAVSMTKPEAIVSVVKELDFADLLLQNESVDNILKTEKIDPAVLGDLADSRFFEAVIEEYTDELIDSIRGDEEDFDFTAATIQDYADEHMNELIRLVRDYMPANKKATDKQIEQAIDRVVNEYGENIINALPDGKDVTEMIGGSGAAQPLILLTGSVIPTVLYSFCAVLAILVFVCLVHKFRGLLCLGIDAVVAALLMLIPYLMLAENGLIRSLLADTAAADLLDPILTLLASKMLIHIVILTIVGILFITGYVTYTVLTKKKAASLPAEVATVEQLLKTVETIEAVEPMPEAAEPVETTTAEEG